MARIMEAGELLDSTCLWGTFQFILTKKLYELLSTKKFSMWLFQSMLKI